jgi:hypothetical protein
MGQGHLPSLSSIIGVRSTSYSTLPAYTVFVPHAGYQLSGNAPDLNSMDVMDSHALCTMSTTYQQYFEHSAQPMV